MNRPEMLSTWELFLGEISRNISPNKEAIRNNLQFLIDRNACSAEYFNAIVSVRYMAAYEQAINEYLHPPTEFKQANIKAELIHFGSLFEGILHILLSNLYNNNGFTLEDYNSWFSSSKARNLVIENQKFCKKQKRGRISSLQLKQLIQTLKYWNQNKNGSDAQFADFVRVIDMLREERNMVHVDAMISSNMLHQEYKLVEIREKWLDFIGIIKDKIQ
ncbi:MAG: hypothetical protein J7647_05555 [Cyanobacteria bacterium SBLK]|nr:hypothetical protein [Cyanobacteria bacterium SBLK]